MSRQLRMRIVGLLAVLLAGLVAIATVIPACGFEAPNLREVPFDAADIPDSPPDTFVHDAAPCSSLVNICVTEDLLRECYATMTLPREISCDWGCTEPTTGNGRCRTFSPSGGAVTALDLDRAMAMIAGLQKRTFTTIISTGTINTDTGQIQIGVDGRQSGTGVRDGVDFKIVNGVGVFRFLELELKGFQDIRVVGTNALALVAIDRISIEDGAVIDLRGTCTGRNAGPGGRMGGASNGNGTGNGAGGAGAGDTPCTGGGGAGHSRGGAAGGGANNAGGTTGTTTISVLAGGAGGGGGSSGDGGGGGGAIQLVSNGQIRFDAANLSQVGINAGGCGGKEGNCGGGAGAGGAILIEGRTVDFSGAFITVNGGGGGGAANGNDGGNALTTTRASGGAGAIGPGSGDDGGDGGGGGDRLSTPSAGGVRDQRGGGGGGGLGWIRVNTRSGNIGGGAYFSPSIGTQGASTGPANAQ
ncbi:MAG: hypothetical protein ACKV2T_23585 [Kofleriaceae bacterium]